jgi:hypothetical protein
MTPLILGKGVKGKGHIDLEGKTVSDQYIDRP